MRSWGGEWNRFPAERRALLGPGSAQRNSRAMLGAPECDPKPQRGGTTKPRVKPWEIRAEALSPEGAAQSMVSTQSLVPPLQGFNVIPSHSRGSGPGLCCHGPSGLKGKASAVQDSSFILSPRSFSGFAKGVAWKTSEGPLKCRTRTKRNEFRSTLATYASSDARMASAASAGVPSFG